MHAATPYHEGEHTVQELAGERTAAEAHVRGIRTVIPSGALDFLGRQSMAVLATVDGCGRPWASLIFGTSGFLEALSPVRLRVDKTRICTDGDEPLWANIRNDPRFGMLLIELVTRRRLRVNGTVVHESDEEAILLAEQVYANCPKYIQRRLLSSAVALREDQLRDPIQSRRLSESQRALIASADTFFVASVHPERGVDASHRGGPPGFVQVLGPDLLRIPDYPGNSMFNTLGNLCVSPAAGLVFPDFRNGRTLQLVGEAEIRWGLEDPSGVTGGTGRFWELRVKETLERTMPFEGVWELLDASPFNL
jgi:hypothetical protein